MAERPSKLLAAARIGLGLVFFVFGWNGFLEFLPLPPLAPEAAAFLESLDAAPYMFPLIKSIEIATGLMFLSGRYVPLALVLLAPILVNIFAFHAFLDAPATVAMPAVLVGMHLALAYAHRRSFQGLFAAKTTPIDR